jgi:ATP adenylyltransferase
MAYILGERGGGCVFCSAFAADPSEDSNHLILYRGTHSCVIMNLFPYNNGHLMIVPFAHEPTFEQLPDEALTEIMTLLNKGLSVLRQAMGAQGFNVGVNIGQIAGAGIQDHVHMHIVPRWSGDTNFITTVGRVRCIPEGLKESFAKLKEVWDGGD